MIKTKATSIAWYCLPVVVVLGCASVTPHQNFINMLNSQVGEKWSELSPHQYPPEEDLISSRELPNGNIEKKYLEGFGRERPCILVYEIDPKTEVIVRADFEGRDEDCVAVP